MALTTQTTKIRYVGDNAAVHFPGPFPVYNAAHVRVFTPDEDGVAQEVTSGFDVFMEEDLTCSVRFYEPLPAGQAITIARILPLEQFLDLVNGGNFSAEEIERTFDETVMQIQLLAEDLDRAIKVSITSEEPAEDAEEVYARVAAIAQRAEDALLHIQNITQSVILAKGVTNLRGTWKTEAALASGSLLRLPVGYFPGRNMLLLMLDGFTCHPAGPDVPPGLPQYEEVGGEDDISRDVRLLFEAPEGAVWSAWSIASNVSQHQEELMTQILAAKASAWEAAALADAAKTHVDSTIFDASDIAADQAAEKAVAAVEEALGPLAAAAVKEAAGDAAALAAAAVEECLCGYVEDARTAAQEAKTAVSGTVVHSPAWGRGGDILAGAAFSVPEYIVGSQSLRVHLDGVLCACGADPAIFQYMETGVPGTASTSIIWHDTIPDAHEILLAL